MGNHVLVNLRSGVEQSTPKGVPESVRGEYRVSLPMWFPYQGAVNKTLMLRQEIDTSKETLLNAPDKLPELSSPEEQDGLLEQWDGPSRKQLEMNQVSETHKTKASGKGNLSYPLSMISSDPDHLHSLIHMDDHRSTMHTYGYKFTKTNTNTSVSELVKEEASVTVTDYAIVGANEV